MNAIRKLKIREKSSFEQLLDILTKKCPNWRDQTLYGWVYSAYDEDSALHPMNVYPNLKDFDVRDVNSYLLYTQGDKFLLTNCITLVTNMEPNKDNRFYDPDQDETLIWDNDIFRIRG